ncbi:uncharacterized protein K460DRAFT_405704 [Cucurbitaria berberidis CBS 394.84]|uniref:Uncharacterized protein n=1 Tax=Cucurbitaria berberidis CBS 394.84 TaxID=1168544 RepID=A0A9P4GH43_9PLEO|nr:uncharacterized protein K460DRAFT_405704 [Cucurbitaria berberidis CBS 394.84]KAF1845445.1 hypothetical protein K460DRAFT_405704 [Cucurbitaria berberidis CBS 394.84]
MALMCESAWTKALCRATPYSKTDGRQTLQLHNGSSSIRFMREVDVDARCTHNYMDQNGPDKTWNRATMREYMICMPEYNAAALSCNSRGLRAAGNNNDMAADWRSVTSKGTAPYELYRATHPPPPPTRLPSTPDPSTPSLVIDTTGPPPNTALLLGLSGAVLLLSSCVSPYPLRSLPPPILPLTCGELTEEQSPTLHQPPSRDFCTFWSRLEERHARITD